MEPKPGDELIVIVEGAIGYADDGSPVTFKRGDRLIYVERYVPPGKPDIWVVAHTKDNTNVTVPEKTIAILV